MRLLLILFLGLYSVNIFAFTCDCDLLVFSPLTGPRHLPEANLKTYERENYASQSAASQLSCQRSCVDAFSEDMKGQRLQALLLVYTQRLINERVVGFNCTGLTTLQYPVVVKAQLGNLSLGNVYRSLQVITHEEVCF